MIVALTSWRGIGTTTAALSLSRAAAARGARPVLVEADPAGGVLAGRLAQVTGGGLEALAFPPRRSTTSDDVLAAAVDHDGIELVTASGDPFRAWSCHQPRVPWAPALRELGERRDVIVDLGRMRGASPAAALLAIADVVLVVSDADVVSLAGTLDWVAALGRVSPVDQPLAADTVRALVVEAPTALEPVRRVDAEADLGDRLAGWLPWSPACASALTSGRTSVPRVARRSPLLRAASELLDRVDRWTTGVAA
jgi:cellulose biosynthesis protein BcsQ